MHKLIFTMLPILMVLVAGSAVAQPLTVFAKLQQIEQQLEAHLEKVKYSREAADQSMSLARMRIGRELKRSEEELERQIEYLGRLKEQIQDQANEMPASVAQHRQDWNQELKHAISGMTAQISDAARLMSKMESIRVKVEDQSEQGSVNNLGLGNVASLMDEYRKKTQAETHVEKSVQQISPLTPVQISPQKPQFK
jgi:DNA anti-recombination protein RmuC